MNNNITSNVSFQSTIVPIHSKKSLEAYFETLSNCNLKSMQNGTVKDCYDKLFKDAVNNNECYTGVKLERDDNKNIIMRFLGYCKENDEYVFKQLKKFDKNARYQKDIPIDGLEQKSFEILV